MGQKGCIAVGGQAFYLGLADLGRPVGSAEVRIVPLAVVRRRQLVNALNSMEILEDEVEVFWRLLFEEGQCSLGGQDAGCVSLDVDPFVRG